MTASSSAETSPSHAPSVWVESMGGPLVVVPVSALAAWRGCTDTGIIVGDGTVPDDYDRACAVDDLAGLIPVGKGGAHALVLGDEPSTTCYLPEHRAFLRWLAADSDAELKAAAETVLRDPATSWEECGTWTVDGPAVLMDSADAGADLGAEYPSGGTPEESAVPLVAGSWRVRAVHTKAGEHNWVGVVQLLPIGV
ncbi:Imm21 family immunity protein [Streptomyces griseorubiginosus]|uniref:Imm21 family immunity protein n=1 Tax=Streptomyces griseorubiginosus TaxID=67304 RepID=UPI0034513C9B